MTKYYSWASDGNSSTSGAITMTAGETYVRGDTNRRFSLRARMQAVRINFAGLPMYLQLGNARYEYRERRHLKEILDGFEILANTGDAEIDISGLFRMSIACKRRGYIIITPKFFPTMRAKLARYPRPQDPGPPAGRSSSLTAAQALLADRIIGECARLAGIDKDQLLTKRCANPQASTSSLRLWRSRTYWLLSRLIPEAAQTALAKHVGKNHKTFLHGVAKIERSASLAAAAKEIEAAMRPVVRGD